MPDAATASAPAFAVNRVSGTNPFEVFARRGHAYCKCRHKCTLSCRRFALRSFVSKTLSATVVPVRVDMTSALLTCVHACLLQMGSLMGQRDELYAEETVAGEAPGDPRCVVMCKMQRRA